MTVVEIKQLYWIQKDKLNRHCDNCLNTKEESKSNMGLINIKHMKIH